MAEIVNLNRARKARAKAAAATQAKANRLHFGRTKAEKVAEAAQRAAAERTLDGARREDGEELSLPERGVSDS